jgi:hypothetical protein
MESLPKVARTKVLHRNIPEDWSLKGRTSCENTLHLGREDDIVKLMQLEVAKCKMSRGPTGAKWQPNRARMGLGRPAWPTPEAVRSPLSWASRWRNPKYVEAPFAGGEPFTREAVQKLERKERRERSSARRIVLLEGSNHKWWRMSRPCQDTPRRRRKTPSRHHDQQCYV